MSFCTVTVQTIEQVVHIINANAQVSIVRDSLVLQNLRRALVQQGIIERADDYTYSVR